MDLGKVDLNFEDLRLTNDTEKAILFLSCMVKLGQQITSYCSGEQFPKNCFRGEKFVSNLPKFNGKVFNEFEVPEFEDFKIRVDIRYDKVSFKEYSLPKYKSAIKSYWNCLHQKE